MAGENEVVPQPRKLKKPVEEIRAELMADPDVKEQARLLQVDLETYVAKIIDYAQYPDKPPQLQITPDEELKARDPSVPTVDELQTYLQKVVNGEVALNRAQQLDGFNKEDPDARFKAALASDQTQTGAPEARRGLSPLAAQVAADPKKTPPKAQ
jgi:hypothetical protein